MKILVALVALVLMAGCGEDEETPASSQAPFADLTVVVDDGSKKTAEVRCDAPGDSEACQAAADIDPQTFEPVPGNQACTQQYGGPETATVKGTLDGKEIDAKFSRVNGCEIARWDAAKPLFEAVG
jgi:hypothetical protein